LVRLLAALERMILAAVARFVVAVARFVAAVARFVVAVAPLARGLSPALVIALLLEWVAGSESVVFARACPGCAPAGGRR
jgi:hypothetical protein